jgi:hypothetical protein
MPDHDNIQGNIPPGWWDDEPTPEEAALLEQAKAISRTLPTPHDWPDDQRTFELEVREEEDVDGA